MIPLFRRKPLPAQKPPETAKNQPSGTQQSGSTHQKKFNSPAKPIAQDTPSGSNDSGKGNFGMKVYILGGLNEVGRNCLALEVNNDILVIDVGLSFPDEEMLGVDFVVPDTDFLEKNQKRIRGVVITHGHLDHIGGLQHVLPKIGFPPLVMTKLTAGLVQKRLEEYGVAKQAKIQVVDPEKDRVQMGCFQLEFFPVNHSIPDCMAVYGKTPVGTFVHTGDFKFDFTPADGKSSDVARMAEIGKMGVDVLLCESTNARKDGYCISEKVVGENLKKVITEATGRIILASFSSLVSRIEQIVHFAQQNNRKVFISGRSMQSTLEIAAGLGYFRVPKGSLRRIGPAVDELPPNQVLILTTGSQGEPRSALTRIGLGTHPQISIQKNDTVVFSSSPIPGNERGFFSSINNLIKMGAKVITNDTLDIHVSGHGHRGDIQMMHRLMKPKIIIPIHGELFMRQAHQKIALDLGYDVEKIPLLENGSILEIDPRQGHSRKSKSKVRAEMIMVDGLGSGDIGTKVMEERKIMSSGGLIVITLKAMEKSGRLAGDPEVFSRGFVYMRESQEILREVGRESRRSYEECLKSQPNASLMDIKKAVERSVQTLVYKKIQREPMICPVLVLV